MVVAIAAGQQPNLTWDPTEPAATITAYIVQVALGDLPHGSIGYQTIFAAGLTLLLITLVFNVAPARRATGRRTDGDGRAGVRAGGRPDLRVEIRANVARRALGPGLSLFGLLATMVGVVVIAALLEAGLRRHRAAVLGFLLSFPSRRAGQAGILSAWVGTLLVMSVTAVVGIPLGVAAATYLEEYAPKNRITALIEINVTNLAGVPSIVYGLLALGLFVYALGFGRSVLSAGLTLAAHPARDHRRDREAIRAVPHGIREAAYAVGAAKWRVTRDHVIPIRSRAS